MEGYRLRRYLSCELPAQDWSNTGSRTDVWNYVDKSFAEMAKLQGLLAASQRDVNKLREVESGLRQSCLINIAEYKVKMEKRCTDERDEYEKEIAIAEQNEMKTLDQLKECLNELKESRRALICLKAECLKKGVEREKDEQLESGRDENVESWRDERGENNNQIRRESGSEREAIEGLKVDMIGDNSSNEVQGDTEEREERQTSEAGGCFAFIRRMFSCFRRTRSARGRANAYTASASYI